MNHRQSKKSIIPEIKWYRRRLKEVQKRAWDYYPNNQNYIDITIDPSVFNLVFYSNKKPKNNLCFCGKNPSYRSYMNKYNLKNYFEICQDCYQKAVENNEIEKGDFFSLTNGTLIETYFKTN